MELGTLNITLNLVLVTLYYGLQLMWSKTIRIGDTNITLNLGLVTLYRGLQLVWSKTIRIGHTKYYTKFSVGDTILRSTISVEQDN